MKIAIFHNFLDNIGGAEIVTLILAKELNADIYTTNIDKEKIKKMGFTESLNRIYSIGKIPKNAPFRQQLTLWKFSRLKLKNKYEVYIISGDWAITGAINNKPNLWYVYSPIREIYDLKNYVKRNMMPFWKRPIFNIWANYNIKSNKKYVKNINLIVSISKIVQLRVKYYFNRDSEIISPPIDTINYEYKKNGNYWLSVNRLINHKRVEIQLKAFEKLPLEKLIIVGSYEGASYFQKYANHIKKIKPKNVEIKNWIDSYELKELYSNCKGFITTSLNEDFGLTPVEAMASGKPIIAPNEGGYKETVINGKTGVLIDDINVDKLKDAIEKLSDELKSKKNQQHFKTECQKQAKKFNKEIFMKKINEKLEEVLKTKNENRKK